MVLSTREPIIDVHPIEVQHILNWVVNLSRLESSGHGVLNLQGGHTPLLPT